jgi:hypothetical protein
MGLFHGASVGLTISIYLPKPTPLPMKKTLWAMFALAIFLQSCENKSEKAPNPLADSLARVNKDLQNQITVKDSSMNMFMGAFNDIQDNLDSIKQKEKLIISSARGEDAANKKEQIKADVQAIYDLMKRNRGNLAGLRAKLKTASENQAKADSTIIEMQKAIERLTSQLDAKDKELVDLKAQLDKLKMDFDQLTTNYKSKEAESNQKSVELNTAYYMVGNAKDLELKGIIKKEGGFIGIGKTIKVMPSFKRDGFNKIDITQLSTIPLSGKKAELLTNHPAGSYTIEGTDKMVKQITISNQQQFWSSSKYLVILVK